MYWCSGCIALEFIECVKIRGWGTCCLADMLIGGTQIGGMLFSRCADMGCVFGVMAAVGHARHVVGAMGAAGRRLPGIEGPCM